MKTEFLKWGNSLALRVPSAFAKEMGASEGKQADMTIERGALVVKIIKPRTRRRYYLENLIAGITEDNRHFEIEWGPAIGNEIW
jgi:antitoxin MazE